MFFIDIEGSRDKTIVLAVGDSICYGAGVNGGWRIPLQALLTNESIPFNFIGASTDNSIGMTDPEHEGYPGRRLDEVRLHVEILPEEPEPDVILLNIGTNDLDQSYLLSTLNDRLDSFIAYMRAKWPLAHIYVATVGPFNPGVNPNVATMTTDAIPYNAHILALTEVTPVNMASYIDASLQADGIHPNIWGYYVMAQVWHDAAFA